MGPSLWQLVTAAIPDSDQSGFARELQSLRTRRERAVTAAGDADAHAAHATQGASPREDETDREREQRRLRELDSEHEALQSRDLGVTNSHVLDREREREMRRQEEARAELALFEVAIAKDAQEERAYELRRIKDREERERVRAATGGAPTPSPTPIVEAVTEGDAPEEDGEGDRFPGLRLPLGVLPNEHLAWTYGTGAMGGVGGAGKRRRLEDMFW
jgi:hypothetical protein